MFLLKFMVSIRSERHGTSLQLLIEESKHTIHVCTIKGIIYNCRIQKLPLAHHITSWAFARKDKPALPEAVTDNSRLSASRSERGSDLNS